jgi:hypothetical protein
VTQWQREKAVTQLAVAEGQGRCGSPVEEDKVSRASLVKKVGYGGGAARR